MKGKGSTPRSLAAAIGPNVLTLCRKCGHKAVISSITMSLVMAKVKTLTCYRCGGTLHRVKAGRTAVPNRVKSGR